MSNAPFAMAMSEQTMMERKFSCVILGYHPAEESVVEQSMFYSTSSSFPELQGKLRGIVGRFQALNPSGSH